MDRETDERGHFRDSFLSCLAPKIHKSKDFDAENARKTKRCCVLDVRCGYHRHLSRLQIARFLKLQDRELGMSLDRVLQPLVACLGNPVGGNPTQFVMTRLAREAELDWRFFTSQVPPELFETAFRGIQALGMSGVAILPPFETSLKPFLDSISPRALALGKVQVVKWESDQWTGDETISTAILRALTHRICAQAVSAQVPPDMQNSNDSFTPQSIGVIGSMALANALQLALVDIPGDYTVLRFDETLKHAKVLPPAIPIDPLSANPLAPANAKAHTERSDLTTTLDPSLPEGSSLPNNFNPESDPVHRKALDPAHLSDHMMQPESSDPSSHSGEDELVLKDRPLRALIIEHFDSLSSSSPQARNRLLKATNFVQQPFAIFVPPADGWTESIKDRSRWIEQLESHGIGWIEEIEVLTHQYAINFEFWSGYEAPLDSIRESLEEYLQW